MRIWWQSSTLLEVLPDYKAALTEHHKRLKKPDTEITYHGVENRSLKSGYRYVSWINEREVFKRLVQAEREGYDAIAVGCFGDPAVPQAREVLSIPVFGMREISMHVASTLGRFAALSATDPTSLEGVARGYGLEDKMAPFVEMEMSREAKLEFGTVFHRAFEDPERVRSSFMKAAEKAIAGGAEVILPGCGVLSEVAVYHGWKKVGDAIVLDQTGTLLKVTEAILDLGYKVPKRTTFPGRPTKESVDEVLKIYGLK